MNKKDYRIINKDSDELKPFPELLPYAIPYSIHIDPTNLCNFKCSFCPTGDENLLKEVDRPKGLMSFDLFKKVIDDIAELSMLCQQKITRLHLYKDGEPFINPNLEEMIRYAKESGISHFIETTSNGSLLTKSRAIEVIKSGLDKIRISVEHINNSGYKHITKTWSNYQLIKDNVSFLFEENKRNNGHLKIHIKIINCNLTQQEKEQFYNDFSSISDSINIDELMGWSNSNYKDFTLGKDIVTGMDGTTKLQRREACPEPFSKLAINFDGQVSVCCVDWSYGTIVGDLKNESFTDIWNGEKLKEFRLLHLRKERFKIKACHNCQYIQGLPEYTLIDDHLDELIKIYS